MGGNHGGRSPAADEAVGSLDEEHLGIAALVGDRKPRGSGSGERQEAAVGEGHARGNADTDRLGSWFEDAFPCSDKNDAEVEGAKPNRLNLSNKKAATTALRCYSGFI